MCSRSKKEIRREISSRFKEAKDYCARVYETVNYYGGSCEAAKIISNGKTYSCVLGYAELADEFPCLSILENFLQLGLAKNIALPIVNNNDILFKDVSKLKPLAKNLATARFGILEPPSTTKTILSTKRDFFPTPEELDQLSPLLVLTPGRAFTQDGARLGRGGGYYDKLFSLLRPLQTQHKNFSFVSVGLCFSFQVLEKLPTEDFDYDVSKVFSEKNLSRAL